MRSGTTASAPLIVGGATGMGAAAAELVKDAGAEVVVMDYAPSTLDGVKAIQVNLGDQASIDAAVEECGGPIHALFSCAGVDEGTPNIEKINFIGHRYLIERPVAKDLLPAASAIAMISSAAGMGWEKSMEQNLEMLAARASTKRCSGSRNGRVGYMSTQAGDVHLRGPPGPAVPEEGHPDQRHLPGPTNTPLAQANPEQWLGFGADYREEAGIEAATPLEQAYPWCSCAATPPPASPASRSSPTRATSAPGSAVSFPAATGVAHMLLGR